MRLERVQRRDRAHFFGACANEMRRILVSYARNRKAGKRGAGADHVPLENAAAAAQERPAELVALDEALERLAETWIDGKLSKLDYIEDGKNFVITHVGVQPEFRGYGVAGKITQVGLEYAKEKSLRVVPMCSYAAAYIRRQPEYTELTRQQEPE